MKPYFEITTTRQVAENAKKEAQTMVRSFVIDRIYHEQKYSVIRIVPAKENSKIEPEDIFWFGFHTCSRELFTKKINL